MTQTESIWAHPEAARVAHPLDGFPLPQLHISFHRQQGRATLTPRITRFFLSTHTLDFNVHEGSWGGDTALAVSAMENSPITTMITRITGMSSPTDPKTSEPYDLPAMKLFCIYKPGFQSPD
ncbi:MAG: hypothetical protein R8K47_06280 [Mariprofundaceae bacterium]